jgi:hypothetical protein
MFKKVVTFNESLELEFPFIHVVNNEKTVAQCAMCNSTFSAASGGKTSTTDHIQAQKHKNVLAAKS